VASVASNSFATGTILSAADRNSIGGGCIDGTYELLSRGACAWRAGNGEAMSSRQPPAAGPPTPQPIALAPGTACLFRREVLERLGGFDESFGSYLEDVDLGLRCLREGLAGVYVPGAMAWHRGSATWGRWNPRVVRAISRNQVLLVARHYDRALFRSCFWPILAGQMLWGVLALRHGAGLAWAAGKWEGLRTFRPEGRDSARLRDFLSASELEIRARARGPYWRWYFRLTGSRLATSRLQPGAAH
jgi:GT2 family glycosyltransferase